MVEREYILDEPRGTDRKIQYELSEWTNYKTDTEYYTLEVRVYEKHPLVLTFGFTKRWKRIEFEHRKIEDAENIRDEFRKMRAVALGEQEDPLELLLDDALVEIEPNHKG